MVLGQGRARISCREATEQFHDCFYIRLPACPSTPSTLHAIEREPHHEERSTTNRERVCREPQCSLFEAQEFMEQRGAHGVDFGRPAAEAEAPGAARSGGPLIGLRPLPCASACSPCCCSQPHYSGVPCFLHDGVIAAA